ncbi:winged helix DNA-binding protein [Pseudonocardia sp. S2-4]|uniref:Winged helix DNA-binding protein n=1 Tax=Pseudonocardia humida TaxID=2800819 RepID=A0ABT1ABF9_9PSEU|nr:winged helix DNA-binding protein [Pseudonocardia humida]
MEVPVADLDLSDISMFAGWAMADELLRRLAADGFGDLRVHDGVVFQHVLAGPLSITDLAGRMDVTQQAASKAVADLERRDLLERRPSDRDGRTRLLRLTERGRAAVAAGRRHRGALDAELAAALGPARVDAARALLAEVLAHLGAVDAVRTRRIRPPA